MGQLSTNLTGWILVALVATTLTLPFLFRRRSLAGGMGGSGPFLSRMKPHFWLAYTILPLTFLHLWPAMSQGWVRGVDKTGLDLASVVFLLLPIQLILGSRLRDMRRSGRVRLRQTHFWLMVTIALFSLGHVVFSTPALRALVPG